MGRRARLDPPTFRTTGWRRVGLMLLVPAILLFGSTGVSGASARPVTKASPPPARPLSSPQVVATARGTVISLYKSPTSRAPSRVISSSPPNGRLVFLVSDASLAPYWVHVYVPTRPDGGQAWIHGSAVQLASDAYLVDVALSSHKLFVFDGRRRVIATPVGVGRSVLPTPLGVYFLAQLLKQPDPDGPYGPYAFGLSAFSNVLQSFGGGPGQIGLHGTDDPASVGGNVSHGCLRLSNVMISKLAHLLPLGTPVLISK